MFFYFIDAQHRPNIPAEYDIIYSHRKTLAIQITPTGQVVIRAPSRCDKKHIEWFVNAKKSWIEQGLARIQSQPWSQPFSREDQERMKRDLAVYLFPRVEALWKQTNFPSYTSIKITASETRWGSCSAKNRLNFSYRLAAFLGGQEHFIDSVIVHELCHLVEKHHQKSFWDLVYTLMPDYQRHPEKAAAIS